MAIPPKRLVACFDGTWNTQKSNTNVSRLFRKIADETIGCPEQRRFYDEGVGTKFGERLRGGVFGAGLDGNIRQGYAWLGLQFPKILTQSPDDAGFVTGPDIFLFGFSRGAFTARSLGGLINYLGLPKLTDAETNGKVPVCDGPTVKAAWDLYVNRPTPADLASLSSAASDSSLATRVAKHKAAVRQFQADNAVYPVRIHCLCVWDTVGALGVPRVFDYSWIPRFSTQYQFHDTTLGGCVTHAFHAVAIDEQREPYCVTLWTAKKETTLTVEQRWFPGAHADVGGGYEDDLLPDPPLAWMAEQAAAHGLCFVNDRKLPDAQGTIPAFIAKRPAAFDLDGREYLSPVHDSYAEFMGGVYKILRSLPGAGGRVYRRMLVSADGINQTVDETAAKKLDAEPQYRPPNLAEAGRPDVNYRVADLD
jgi:hypothetical protein